MIKDHRGIQIGWSVGGDFYKKKSDAPITDPLPVFKKVKKKRKKALTFTNILRKIK